MVLEDGAYLRPSMDSEICTKIDEVLAVAKDMVAPWSTFMAIEEITSNAD